MALTKKQEDILARLYALRAGLSAVAQEKEAADSLMASAKQGLDNAIEQAGRSTKNAEKDVEQLHCELRILHNEQDYAQKIADSPDASTRAKHKAKSALLLLLGVALSIFLAVSPVIGTIAALNGQEWGYAFVALWLPLIGLGIFLLRTFVGKYKEAIVYKYSLQERGDAIRKLESLATKKEALQQAIVEAQKHVEVVRKYGDDRIEEMSALYAEKNDEAIEHAQTGVAIIDGLEKAFGDLIDKRDWENIDIIIYSIETRRADDFKEALTIVDRERHTERIAATITQAGLEVQQSIQAGLNHLQSQMNECFDSITTKLDLQSAATQLQIAGLSMQTAGVAAQVNMQNALLAKANTTSAELAATAKKLSQDTRDIKDKLRKQN